MTDKEVRKLKRAELLEILFYLQKEMENLRQENENLRRQLESASEARISGADMERLIGAVKEAVSASMKETPQAQENDGAANRAEANKNGAGNKA